MPTGGEEAAIIAIMMKSYVFFCLKKRNVLKKGYNNYLMGHCTVGNTIDEKDWMHLPAAFSVCRPTSTPSPLVENFRSAKRPQGY